jgi:hypothetical protein
MCHDVSIITDRVKIVWLYGNVRVEFPGLQ